MLFFFPDGTKKKRLEIPCYPLFFTQEHRSWCVDDEVKRMISLARRTLAHAREKTTTACVCAVKRTRAKKPSTSLVDVDEKTTAKQKENLETHRTVSAMVAK